MYESFGGIVNQADKTVKFRLFVPDGERVPSQYEGGGLPRLSDVFVVGSFQHPDTRAWDLAARIPMMPSDYIDPQTNILKGTVYSSASLALPDGFYEYKYWCISRTRRRGS